MIWVFPSLNKVLTWLKIFSNVISKPYIDIELLPGSSCHEVKIVSGGSFQLFISKPDIIRISKIYRRVQFINPGSSNTPTIRKGEIINIFPIAVDISKGQPGPIIIFRKAILFQQLETYMSFFGRYAGRNAEFFSQ